MLLNELKDFIVNEVEMAVQRAIAKLGLLRASLVPAGVRYLTRKQVAIYLSIDEGTVDKWARAGILRRLYFHKGCEARYDKEEIDKIPERFVRYVRMDQRKKTA